MIELRDYYEAVTDAWRLFRHAVLKDNAFTDDWWADIVSAANEYGHKQPHPEFRKEIILAMVSELDRLAR